MLIKKHLSWIQLFFLIGGLVFIYGQQMQSLKDVERRTAQCEENIRSINVSSQELMNTIYEIRADIREIKTDIKYLRAGR